MRICSSTLGSTTAQRGGQFFLESLFPKTEAMLLEHRKRSRASWYAISSYIFIFCDWHRSLQNRYFSLLQDYDDFLNIFKRVIARIRSRVLDNFRLLTQAVRQTDAVSKPTVVHIGDSEYQREVIEVPSSNLGQAMKMLILCRVAQSYRVDLQYSTRRSTVWCLIWCLSTNPGTFWSINFCHLEISS